MTIYEIATRAGVSSSTVARVLRGDARENSQKSAETARRIRAIAKELGYRPNLRARAFSRRSTRTIGLVYDEDVAVFDGVNAAICNGLVRKLQQKQYHLVFVPVRESGTWIEAIYGGQLDGGIIFQAVPELLRGTLAEQPIPFVLIGDKSEKKLSRAYLDDFAGGYLATKHLLGLNHRRIMFFVHDSVFPHSSVLDRVRGYRSALNEANAIPCECIHTSEIEAIEKLVRCDEQATAAICHSERESIMLMHGLWQCGLSVPEDVSLVGFNEVFSTQHMTPPLTTIAFDAGRFGEECATLILREMATWRTNVEPTQLAVKLKLVIRGSTAMFAPKGGASG